MKVISQLRIEGDFTITFVSGGKQLHSCVITAYEWNDAMPRAACHLAKNLCADIITMYPNIKNEVRNDTAYLAFRDRLKNLQTKGNMDTLREWLPETIAIAEKLLPKTHSLSSAMRSKVGFLREMITLELPKPLAFD